jgi:hypothetical protein
MKYAEGDMPHLILSAAQAQLLNETDRVAVLGPNGNLLGHFDPIGWTPEEIVEIKRRASECKEWYTGEQVQGALQALDRALAAEGSIDEKRAREIREEFRAGRSS